MPTPEQIQEVREWECRERGHDWTFIQRFGVDIPAAILCENCGKKANVEAES